MRLENYELVDSLAVPCYWYEEGEEKEHYWFDYQNMVFTQFNREKTENGEPIETRKYWIISPYKPIGSVITEENADKLIKWLVTDSWHTDPAFPNNDGVDYEFFEWNFEKHCVKPVTKTSTN